MSSTSKLEEPVLNLDSSFGKHGTLGLLQIPQKMGDSSPPPDYSWIDQNRDEADPPPPPSL